jgi:hypothetical protein
VFLRGFLACRVWYDNKTKASSDRGHDIMQAAAKAKESVPKLDLGGSPGSAPKEA